MTKRTQHTEKDESMTYDEAIAVGSIAVIMSEHIQRLIDSGIVNATDSAISWREGHLEHLAQLYAADPVQTWRDYTDDLTVALSADGSHFSKLVDKARGK